MRGSWSADAVAGLLASGPQRGDREDADAIWALVAISDGNDHREGGGRAASGLVQPSGELQQVACAFLDAPPPVAGPCSRRPRAGRRPGESRRGSPGWPARPARGSGRGRGAPASPDRNPLGHVTDRVSGRRATGRNPVQERAYRDGTGGLAGLEQRHGAHPQPGQATGTGVSGDVIGRHGRAGQDELPGAGAIVHRAADVVPDGDEGDRSRCGHRQRQKWNVVSGRSVTWGTAEMEGSQGHECNAPRGNGGAWGHV